MDMSKFKIGDYVSTSQNDELHNFKRGVIIDINVFSNILYYKIKILEGYSKHSQYNIGNYFDLEEYEIEKYIEEPNFIGIKTIDILLGRNNIKENIWYSFEFKKYPHAIFKFIPDGTIIAYIWNDGEILSEHETEYINILSKYKIYEWNKVKECYKYE